MLQTEVGQRSQKETILAGNWDSFVAWKNETGARQTLAVPEDIAPVFIPERILDISRDPEHVRVLTLRNKPDSLGFLVYERMDHPLSDPDRFVAWYQEVSKDRTRIPPYSQDESPPGIDYKQNYYADLIQKGVLTLNDKVYLEYYADVLKGFPETVQTRNLRDRPELHRQGIGTSFYQRLGSVLRQLEFAYLAEYVVSRHLGFFQKTGTPFPHLPETVKKELPDYPPVVANDHLFIKFLQPRKERE